MGKGAVEEPMVDGGGRMLISSNDEGAVRGETSRTPFSTRVRGLAPLIARLGLAYREAWPRNT